MYIIRFIIRPANTTKLNDDLQSMFCSLLKVKLEFSLLYEVGII